MKKRISRNFYAASVLLTGLFSSQILAILHVYISNTRLLSTLMVIQDNNYLSVPNQKIMQGLQDIGPAFLGGLFFSLSTGAGLTLCTFAAVWAWDRIFYRNKIVSILYLLLWTGCIVVVNLRGFYIIGTSFFLVIPLVVSVVTMKFMPEKSRKKDRLGKMVLMLSVFLFGFLWVSQMNNAQAFINVRDNILFSNSLGTTINDLYYKYTLYAAEVIKSQDQKTLKTCNLGQVKNKTTAGLLKNELLKYNYFDIGEPVTADLNILEDGKILLFENRGRTTVRTTTNEFLSKAENILTEFSMKSDTRYYFSRLTFISLLLGIPFIIYVFVYTLFSLIMPSFLGSNTTTILKSVFCLITGAALLSPLYIYKEKGLNAENVSEALNSENWRVRVAALKTIVQDELEIGYFQSYQSMLASPNIPERYWLARALGISRQPKTFKHLFAFLDDPHPNVVCMAFYALGQRGDRSVIKEIIERIKSSDHWYEQLYAYNALMALGWRQTTSR